MAFRGLENAQFGISMFPTDYSIQPAQMAQAVEERGFDSLFFPEHTHIPTNRATPFPGGGDLAQEYWHAHDPFVALSVAAAVTERIHVGTGVCLIIERDPITTAKVIASLDVVSNGRAIIGIGAGWNREEMENHGADYKNRWPIVREKVQAMRSIWTNDEAEYHGDYVDFDPIWCWPKPVQEKGPPIWIGAQSRYTIERVADYADGWMPIGGMSPEQLDELRQRCDQRGRNIEDITLALFGALPDAEVIKRRIAEGFDVAIFNAPSAPADQVFPVLDRYAEVVRQIRA